MSRGIRQIPIGIDMQTRLVLQDMKAEIERMRSSQAPPDVPSNLKVTPQAFSNLVQWTRSTTADFFEVLWSPTPNLSQATVVNVGNSQQWSDQVGNTGVQRWYWVRSRKNSGSRSLEVGPQKGTTLASNAGVTPPTPPVDGQRRVLNRLTGRPEYETL